MFKSSILIFAHNYTFVNNQFPYFHFPALRGAAALYHYPGAKDIPGQSAVAANDIFGLVRG